MSSNSIEVFASNEDPNSASQASVKEEVPVVWMKLLREMQHDFRKQGLELHELGEFEYAKLAGDICDKVDLIIDHSMHWAIFNRNQRIKRELP